MRRRRLRLVPPRLPSGPPQIEEHPTPLRVWSQPAGHLEPRPVWEVIVSRESTREELRNLLVRLAWELRVSLDEAAAIEAEVRRRLRACDG